MGRLEGAGSPGLHPPPPPNALPDHVACHLARALQPSCAAQDVVVEELFKNYFAESKFPNDRAVLIQGKRET